MDGRRLRPEAGLIGIAAILLGSLLIVLWVQGRYRALAFFESYAVYTPLHGAPQHAMNLPNEAAG